MYNMSKAQPLTEREKELYLLIGELAFAVKIYLRATKHQETGPEMGMTLMEVVARADALAWGGEK